MQHLIFLPFFRFSAFAHVEMNRKELGGYMPVCFRMVPSDKKIINDQLA
jgi:hypothetical protein